MDTALLIIGLILGSVMIARSLVVVTLTELVIDPLFSETGRWVVLMTLLWLIGVAFVLGVPAVSVIAFVSAASFGLAIDLWVREEFTELALWGALSLVLAVLCFGGWWEKERADARDAETRAQIEMIAETLER